MKGQRARQRHLSTWALTAPTKESRCYIEYTGSCTFRAFSSRCCSIRNPQDAHAIEKWFEASPSGLVKFHNSLVRQRGLIPCVSFYAKDELMVVRESSVMIFFF